MHTAIYAAVAATAIGGALSASVQAQTWVPTGGTHAWADDANWTGGAYPNAPGAVANLTNDLTALQNVTIPTAGNGGITLGVLNIGDGGAAPDSRFDLSFNGLLIFDNGSNPAQINTFKDAAGINEWDVIWSNIRLDSDLVVDSGPNAASTLRINGTISDGPNGPRTLTKTGPGFLEIGQVGQNQAWTGGTILSGGRLRLNAGSNWTLLPGDIEISGEATLQGATGNGHAIADTAVIRFTGLGYYNPGFDGIGVDEETIGGLESTGTDAHDAQVGGGVGTLSFGGTNADHVFEGRIGSSTSYTKVGTGVQELAGTLHNFTSGTRSFSVHGGRVDLNKDAGVTSVAQALVNIGDGSQSGENRPELRLLQSEQIQVQSSSATTGTETSAVTLNSGIFNLNGNSETVGSMLVTGSGKISTIATGAAGSLAVPGGLTVDDGARAEVQTGTTGSANFSGLTLNGSGTLDVVDSRAPIVIAGGDATAIRAAIITGRGGAGGTATWTGNGITSSSAAASPITRAVGYNVSGGNVNIRYTVAGDANLDGSTDGSDLNVWNDNKFQGNRDWSQADFNYDGSTDGSDLNVWNDNKFTMITGASAASVATNASGHIADMIYDPSSGQLKLVVHDVGVVQAAILVETAEGNVIAGHPGNLPNHPFGFQSWSYRYFNGKMQFTDDALNLGGGASVGTGEYVIGTLLTGLGLSDFGVVEYGSNLGTQFTTVSLIPEPGTFGLAAVVAAGTLLRRRRRTA